MRRPSFIYAVECSVGLAFSSANPLGVALVVAMPALVIRQRSRSAAYRAAIWYYAGALWPLIPGAKNFFGPDVSPLSAAALWVCACLLLAAPWPLVWSGNPRQRWWRAGCGLALGIVPPFGIFGLASPILAAGFLFPGTRWFGLAACGVLPGLLATRPRYTGPALVGAAVVCNLICPPIPPTPPGWIAVNTRFGAIAHEAAKPITEYRTATVIQQSALSADGRVLLFPETVVPTWTAATDAFWRRTLDTLRDCGKVVIIGARLPVPTRDQQVAALSDLRPAVSLLRGDPGAVVTSRGLAFRFRYENGMVIRGVQTAVFRQRIPVPIAMWKPFHHDGARLNLFGPGTVTIGKWRAAPLICYEQLLVWPALTSLLENPQILLAPANDYWAVGTIIPANQRRAVEGWGRLFRIPWLFAVNT